MVIQLENEIRKIIVLTFNFQDFLQSFMLQSVFICVGGSGFRRFSMPAKAGTMNEGTRHSEFCSLQIRFSPAAGE
jgi:hypothetical protein